MSSQRAPARVPLCLAFVEIHQEEPTQSLATKSDKSGKFSGAKFENCYFNVQVVWLRRPQKLKSVANFDSIQRKPFHEVVFNHLLG